MFGGFCFEAIVVEQVGRFVVYFDLFGALVENSLLSCSEDPGSLFVLEEV